MSTVQSSSNASSGLTSDPRPLASLIPDGALPEYANLLTKIQNVINALVEHPGIKDNKLLKESDPNQAPPKQSQNKVFFMWDFNRNSRDSLLRLDPKLPQADQEAFQEIKMRQFFAAMLLKEKPGGKLSVMTGEKKGEELDFGDEIRRLADELQSQWQGGVSRTLYGTRG